MLISNLTMAVLRVTMVHDTPGFTEPLPEYELLPDRAGARANLYVDI